MEILKRVLSLALVASLTCSTLVRAETVATLGGEGDAQAAGTPEAAALMRKYSEKLRIGSTVKVKEIGGRRFTALLMAVDEQGVAVKPKTRIPERARVVPFDRLEQLEPTKDGSSVVKAVAAGAAVGAATFVGLLLIAVAASGG
jgi:hypothetical protein